MNLYWQRFLEHAARQSVSGSLRSLAGVGAAWTNSLLPFLNATYLTSPVTDAGDLDRRVAIAQNDAAAWQLPWAFFVFEPHTAALGRERTMEILAGRHMTLAMSVAVMTGDARGLTPARPAALEYRRVEREADARAVMEMNYRAYGMPVELAASVVACRPLFVDAAREFGYLGLLNGVPVSTATVIELDGWLYVALVATEPDHMRHGYADAVMRHALAQAAAATGVTRTTLDATAMGAPVYERMGYAKTGELWSMYMTDAAH